MTTSSEVRIRWATLDDLAAMHRVFCRAEREVDRARNDAYVDPPLEVFSIGSRHLLAHDPEQAWVAEFGGRVVGLGAAIVREGTRFLSRPLIEPRRRAAASAGGCSNSSSRGTGAAPHLDRLDPADLERARRPQRTAAGEPDDPAADQFY